MTLDGPELISPAAEVDPPPIGTGIGTMPPFDWLSAVDALERTAMALEAAERASEATDETLCML
jgi:hypothetical protein